MVQRMQAQGMSANQIAAQLQANGVTEAQMMRIQAQVESSRRNYGEQAGSDAESLSRMRTADEISAQEQAAQSSRVGRRIADDDSQNEQANTGRQVSNRSGNGQNSRVNSGRNVAGNEVDMSDIAEGDQDVEVEDGQEGGDGSRNVAWTHRESEIFGHSIFNNNRLTFEPNLNIATPENYVLGPGDEVIIDIWGNSQQTVRQVISPDGSIVADPVGMIRLAGLSVSQANARIRQAFSTVYSLDGGTFLNLSLGQIRSIQVNVMGEALVPGTYTVPSLATLFHVLYRAGGVNRIGSMRDIRVVRGGKEIARVDIYDYLLYGRTDLNIAMKDGDVIVVKPYANLVQLHGKVKRPMIYELKNGETMSTLIGYAGGFTGDAYTKSVRVTRRSGLEMMVFNVEEAGQKEFLLTDCDIVNVEAILERYKNRVQVLGAVFRPGDYALGGDVNTVKELVEKAEGLRGDVFTGRAVIYRYKADYTREAIAIDIVGIMNGTIPDEQLQRSDVVAVSSIFDLNETKTISINGAVAAPGTYSWADNMTLEDFVVRAGGLLESASLMRVDVVQRIKEANSVEELNLKGVHLSFELKKGLVVSGDRDYILHPFDAVYVRRSPGYSEQKNINVSGQVLYGGDYAIINAGERLSTLINRAGGLTNEAYVSGARLMRRKSLAERAREEAAVGLAIRSRGAGDSLTVESLNISEYYSVAIQLDKAMERPGSDYDLVLREGDQLFVPEYQGTVSIAGAVLYPNTVSFTRGLRPRAYVARAGGFVSRARKSKTYVIHMNGSVEESRLFRKPRVTPGALVVVPLKGAPRNPMSTAEVVGLATSVTSLGAIVTSLMNLSK